MNDRRAPYRLDEPRYVLAAPVTELAGAEQHRHHDFIAEHGRERDRLDDYHARRRREAAEIGGKREPPMAIGQRELEHERIRRDLGAAELLQAGGGDRNDENADQRQVSGEEPARRAHIGERCTFNDRHMELSRKAEDRHAGENGLSDEAEAPRRIADRLPQLREVECVPVRIGEAVAQAVHHVQSDPQKRDQLHDRFERDREDHAVVVLAAHDFARAEENRKRGQQRRDEYCAVQEERGFRRGSAGENLEAEGDRFQLERHVWQDSDHGDAGDQHRDRLVSPVARADKVGNGGDVVALRDAHDPREKRRTEHKHQHGSEVNGEEVPAAVRGTAHGAVEGPRRAVHAEGEAVHPRLAGGCTHEARPPIPEIRDREQQRDVTHRDRKQCPRTQHRCGPRTLGRAIIYSRAMKVTTREKSVSII